MADASTATLDRTDLTRRRLFDALEAPAAQRCHYQQRIVSHLLRMIRYCDEVGVDFDHACELALGEHLAESDPIALDARYVLREDA